MRRPPLPCRRLLGGLAVSATLTLTACSTDEAAPTPEELLAALEGRELTAAEQSEQLQILDLLCTLDDDVLIALWDKLDDDQLAKQDIAFGITCPERNQLYAEATGRFAVND